MEKAIIIQQLSKNYRHRTATPYVSIRDVISGYFSGLFRRKKASDFYALKNINLTVHQGERLAVIGANGAGKSTLLKILSRITPPTTGKVELNGRVASLLEVGTGFHPELTGRENIYLNGSILGLKRHEIEAKQEAIIEFSGIRSFIDLPLKQYSSGMQLRLAFSVAAHLEPEILLIDEVLAVGDLEFQKKCIGKMEEVSRQNHRTILFVSHNLAAVQRLCTRAIVLREGELVFEGGVQEAIRFYSGQFATAVEKKGSSVFNLENHPNKIIQGEGLMQASLLVNGQPAETFIPGADMEVRLEYFNTLDLVDPDVGIVIKDSEQNALIGLNSKHFGRKLALVKNRKRCLSLVLPGLNLYAPGTYHVNLYFGDVQHYYECLYDAFSFTIEETDVYGTGNLMEAEWNRIYIPQIDIVHHEP
ncbi:MAG: ABC transporter ATP-binding protein [Flavisolibacter sp.]